MSLLRQIDADVTPIMPGVGGRLTPVSVAFRPLSGGTKQCQRWIFVISLSKQTTAELGYAPGSKSCYAEIGFDERTGTLMVVNVEGRDDIPDSIRWKGTPRQGTLVFSMTARWLSSYRERHAAERCEYKIMSHDTPKGIVRYAEITVPDWAAPMRKSAQAARGAADAARARAGLAATPHVRPGPR